MQDFSHHDDKTLCVLMREQLLDLERRGVIAIYRMPSKWENAAKFIDAPYYWRHNLVSDIQRLAKEDAIDLPAWPLAQEFVRRWGDKSIRVRCTRSDGTAYATRINATEAEARAYFMGSTGEEMVNGKEVKMAPVVKVEVCNG